MQNAAIQFVNNHSISGYVRWLKEYQQSKSAISQEDYFARQLELIKEVEQHVLFEGYDSRFMERGSTVDALRKLIADPTGDVKIYAILQEGKETVLDEIAKSSSLVDIVKTAEKLEEGYIALDFWGPSLWDSTKPTLYIPEANKGVIYRRMLVDKPFIFKNSEIGGHVYQFCERSNGLLERR